MKNKYIVHLGPGKSMPGGMLSVIQNILSTNMYNLKRKQIHIATASKSHKILTFIVAIVRISCLCLINKISIAHIHMSERGSIKRTIILVNILHYFGAKIIIHSHGGMISNEYNSMSTKEKNRLSNCVKMADIIIVLTEGWRDFWKEIVDKAKIRIVPNGVDLPTVVNKEYRRNDMLNILYLGYISKDKGAFDLVTALSILNKNGFKYHATFAGNGESDTLIQSIKEKKLESDIEYVGWVDNEKKRALFEKYDILVLPSYFESFGIVAIEAMSWKLPVICGDRGYTREVMVENETGYIARVGDCEDLANKIMRFDNAELLSYMGDAGYKLVKNNYNLPSVMKLIEMIYQELL